jgi:hypothetical protein
MSELRQFDLGSPIVTLAALYWAAENRPDWVGYNSGKELLIAAFGGGSSEFLVSKFKEIVGGIAGTLGDEAIQGIVGALMVKYGGNIHPAVSTMGRGVIFDLAMRSFRDAGFTLEKFIGGIKLGQPCNQNIEIKQEQPMTMEEYVLAKYGVKV